MDDYYKKTTNFKWYVKKFFEIDIKSGTLNLYLKFMKILPNIKYSFMKKNSLF